MTPVYIYKYPPYEKKCQGCLKNRHEVALSDPFYPSTSNIYRSVRSVKTRILAVE